MTTLDNDGRFVLADVLRVGEFPADPARGQDAFQDFRKRVNQVADEARIGLVLELDSRKTTPHRRYGWFTGGNQSLAQAASVDEAAGCVNTVVRDHIRATNELVARLSARLDGVDEALGRIADGQAHILVLLRERDGRQRSAHGSR